MPDKKNSHQVTLSHTYKQTSKIAYTLIFKILENILMGIPKIRFKVHIFYISAL